jgi:hypothetical protein
VGNFLENCKRILDEAWSEIVKQGLNVKPHIDDPSLQQSIRNSINSKTKSYRYVLPTQLISKLANPSLDSRCLQATRGGIGDFDARSVNEEVVVKFDKDNENVLGGSPQPYVNNPLRKPEITFEYGRKLKDKEGWLALCETLQKVETANSPEFTRRVLDQTLYEVLVRLSKTNVQYPVPQRISLEQTDDLINQFLSGQSVGDRPQAIGSALLETIGEEFKIFSEIKRSKTTSADASTGQVGDIECFDGQSLVLGVEIKDKELTLNEVRGKTEKIRTKGLSEFMFLLTKGIFKKDEKAIFDCVQKEFSSGQNIYLLSFQTFVSDMLALLGESGRKKFLMKVGETLNKYTSEIEHRRAWAELLSKI